MTDHSGPSTPFARNVRVPEIKFEIFESYCGAGFKFLFLHYFVVWEHAHTTLTNTGATQPFAHAGPVQWRTHAYDRTSIVMRVAGGMARQSAYSCAPTVAPTVSPILAQCGSAVCAR